MEFSLCLLFAKLVSYTFLYWLPLYIVNVGEFLGRVRWEPRGVQRPAKGSISSPLSSPRQLISVPRKPETCRPSLTSEAF